MDILNGKIAIVTGASRSRGIGSAICLMLAEAGADIFFTHWSNFDKNEGIGAEEDYPNILCNKIKDLGVRCHHMEADLSDPETPTNILNCTKKTLGTASVLINNATYHKSVDFRTMNVEVLDRHYQINNSGTIAYIASKGMLIAITEPLSAGLAPIGITVNLIDPGPTDSGWMDKEIRESLSQFF